MRELKLYALEGCPYCARVKKVIEEKNIDVEILDIEIKENSDALIAVGGKESVPMLSIDGEAMYGTDKIIDWLNENY